MANVKKVNCALLLPSLPSLKMHIKRANDVAVLWANAHLPHPADDFFSRRLWLVSPSEFGHFTQQNRRRTFRAAKLVQDILRNIIGTGQNRRRPKSAQKKNEPTWLYSALIKKNSCAKLIVLRLMVTRYIGNMIVFLRCHYAHLSNHYYKQVISTQSQ